MKEEERPRRWSEWTWVRRYNWAGGAGKRPATPEVDVEDVGDEATWGDDDDGRRCGWEGLGEVKQSTLI